MGLRRRRDRAADRRTCGISRKPRAPSPTSYERHLAIRVENLGKRYAIGKRERYKTLRDSLTESLTAPFRWMRHRNSVDAAGRAGSHSGRSKTFPSRSRGRSGRPHRSNGAGKSRCSRSFRASPSPPKAGGDPRPRRLACWKSAPAFTELTGRENIYLNGAILGMKQGGDCQASSTRSWPLPKSKVYRYPVKHYSSGMYMRLAFAVAAHLEPEILIVDEVLAVGDAEFQKKCLGKMGTSVRAVAPSSLSVTTSLPSGRFAAPRSFSKTVGFAFRARSAKQSASIPTNWPSETDRETSPIHWDRL